MNGTEQSRHHGTLYSRSRSPTANWTDEARRLQAHWAGQVAGRRPSLAVMNPNTPRPLAEGLPRGTDWGAWLMPLVHATELGNAPYLAMENPDAAAAGIRASPRHHQAAREWGDRFFLSIVVSQGVDYICFVTKPTASGQFTGASGEAPPGAQGLSSLRLIIPYTREPLGPRIIALLTLQRRFTKGKPRAGATTMAMFV